MVSGDSSEASWEQCGVSSGGGVRFPFCFNWKLEFLDKAQTERHLAESFHSARGK